VHDAKRHGVDVLPPDINASAAFCTVESDALRVGFGYVQSIGERTAKAIAAERTRNGDYRSLADFTRRMNVVPAVADDKAERGGRKMEDGSSSILHRSSSIRAINDRTTPGNDLFTHLRDRPPDLRWGSRTDPPPAHPVVKEEGIENLIQTGAFDAFGMNRRELLWQLGLLYRPPSAQIALPMPLDQDLARLSDLTTWERMAADYNLLSLSPNYHPMQLLRPQLGESLPSLRHLEQMSDGARVRVPGMVVCRQQPGTAKGFVFLLLEDEYGMLNVIVPPWLHERQRAEVRGEAFVIVEGELQRKENTVNLLAERFRILPVPSTMRPPESHNFG
jgi:error-prone DNA polymerase